VCEREFEEKRQYSHGMYMLFNEFKFFEGFFPMRNQGKSAKYVKPKVVILAFESGAETELYLVGCECSNCEVARFEEEASLDCSLFSWKRRIM
jgi:hypothetical protein